LTYGLVISGTTDQDWLSRVASPEARGENLIVIGSPDSNSVIRALNELGALPAPLRERRLELTSESVAAVAPGSSLTYTFSLTNTTSQAWPSLTLINTLPAYTQRTWCSPECSETGGQVRWPSVSLSAGQSLNFALGLRVTEAITQAVIENTATVLDAATPLNVSTLTTTVGGAAPRPVGLRRTASASRYLFTQRGSAVPENDGVVQELVSPWDPRRAILVITGLNDEAVYRASLAMSFGGVYPGMKGPVALVRDVTPAALPISRTQATDVTLADLGYEDKILKGYFDEVSYYFDVPTGWRMTEQAFLDLRLGHTGRLTRASSSMNVLLNDKPLATVALSEDTAASGAMRIKLPPSLVRPGASNKLSIQANLRPMDECQDLNLWLLVENTSLLHLDHQAQNTSLLDLALYPYPLNQRSDLADVLFVLPPEPLAQEWQALLRLAAKLGPSAGGPDLMPAVATGDAWQSRRLTNYHIVSLGRPTRNSLAQKVNERLPQPFLPGSDSIEQKLGRVTLRLPPDVSLGYVQLAASPWNSARVLLALTGTTEAGVQEALDVVLNRPWEMRSNLVLIQDDKVKTIETRALTQGGVASAVATAVPALSPVATATEVVAFPQPGSTPAGLAGPPVARPAWLLPLVIVSGLAIVASLAIAYWQARRGRA
jgi:hypothetical protein